MSWDMNLRTKMLRIYTDGNSKKYFALHYQAYILKIG